ncbi:MULTISPECIES: hypothetical protein [Terrisporobacter]|uniref:Uncharacterized protein n=1 Tax=Terrisporobacter othiniensis TaxID=1577792 RepID=A0A0B3WVE3_9FIRM|nr:MULTISPECIES: hypothetical protein [Terrisporobacter]KHS58560.1 hypothetical protein QX51_02045 [Terrisporobacter othiniensis]MCC3669319.1 hypothetical protein [Terrisporobacter mayombei]MDU6983653.1 hypothetical protein [Terrisporobacter othiniensis]
MDGYSNRIYNSELHPYGDSVDLSKGDFTISGTTVDTSAPEIDETTIQVEKSDLIAGNVAKISMKATDETGIKSAHMFYRMPISGQNKYVDLSYNQETNRYEATCEINDKSELGVWKIESICFEDLNGYSSIPITMSYTNMERLKTYQKVILLYMMTKDI